MNSKTPYTSTDWTFQDLKSFGFKPHKYYSFKNRWYRYWYNLFGDKLFEVPKILNESQVTMCYENYEVCCDEWGYLDIFYTEPKNKTPILLAQLGRRDIILIDVFDVIKSHRREINLNKLIE